MPIYLTQGTSVKEYYTTSLLCVYSTLYSIIHRNYFELKNSFIKSNKQEK